jgi:hypothetical protein
VWAVVAGRLYYAADAAQNWVIVHEGPGLGWIAAEPKDPRKFCVSGAKSVYRTDDGKDFRPIAGPKVAGRMACDSLGRLYLAAYRGQRAGLCDRELAGDCEHHRGQLLQQRLQSVGRIAKTRPGCF